jgi:hypothetical protein
MSKKTKITLVVSEEDAERLTRCAGDKIIDFARFESDKNLAKELRLFESLVDQGAPSIALDIYYQTLRERENYGVYFKNGRQPSKFKFGKEREERLRRWKKSSAARAIKKGR